MKIQLVRVCIRFFRAYDIRMCIMAILCCLLTLNTICPHTKLIPLHLLSYQYEDNIYTLVCICHCCSSFHHNHSLRLSSIRCSLLVNPIDKGFSIFTEYLVPKEISSLVRVMYLEFANFK